MVCGGAAEKRPPATPEPPAALEAGRGASGSLLFFFPVAGASDDRGVDEARNLPSRAAVDASCALQQAAHRTNVLVVADASAEGGMHVRLKLALDGRGGIVGVGERAFGESNGGGQARRRRSRRRTPRATDETTVERASTDGGAHARRALALEGCTGIDQALVSASAPLALRDDDGIARRRCGGRSPRGAERSPPRRREAPLGGRSGASL